MIKILWVCNVPIPKIAQDMGIKAPNINGWLSGFATSLESNPNIELHICFPVLGLKKMVQGKIQNIHYYAFSQPKTLGFLPAEDQLHASKTMKIHIKKIIGIVQPNILHIFGTEYPHSLVAVKTFNNPNNTVINIQGLTSYYWTHYNLGIPYKVLTKFSLSNIARGSLLKQAKKLKKRGEFEIETLKNVGHVIGRTDWDKACTKQINSRLSYHFCNESLREAFYDSKWDFEKCEKHSIFMSQAATPIKGIHFMIQAMPKIIKEFPDAHLYIAGNDLTSSKSLYEKIKISSYANYVKLLIKENELESKVTFTGPLDEQKMKNRFLKSNVFISPSTIENSPNSLGEAMIMGVPCISSDVGGVKNLIEHGHEGFIYQADAPYMLSYYVGNYFREPKLAKQYGEAGQKHAKNTHNKKINIDKLLNIYGEIYNE